MKKWFKWLLMLNKRLYKKPVFIIILAIIPIAVGAFSYAAKGESGFVNIALACEDNNDSVSGEIVKKLLDEKSLIHFSFYEPPDKAISSMYDGNNDAVWIFPSGMQEKIGEFSKAISNYEAVVRVVEREEKITLRLAREKLSAAIYKYCARAYYMDFAKANTALTEKLSENELYSYYDNLNITEQLFEFDSHTKKAESGEQEGYLVAPIRGLLSVVIFLCSMAATLFFMQDEKNGTFSLVPLNKRNHIALVCVMIAVLNVAVMVLISLFAAGLATTVLRELLSLILYSFCCAAFCLLLKQLVGSIKLFGSIIPLVVIITIALCPVFFDFRGLLSLQLLLPPTYYINSVYSNMYFAYMPLYAVVCLIATFVLKKLTRKIV